MILFFLSFFSFTVNTWWRFVPHCICVYHFQLWTKLTTVLHNDVDKKNIHTHLHNNNIDRRWFWFERTVKFSCGMVSALERYCFIDHLLFEFKVYGEITKFRISFYFLMKNYALRIKIIKLCEKKWFSWIKIFSNLNRWNFLWRFFFREKYFEGIFDDQFCTTALVRVEKFGYFSF